MVPRDERGDEQALGVGLPKPGPRRGPGVARPRQQGLFLAPSPQVNMVVLGWHLGIPKPFGPIINGRCCLEEEVRSLLEPLGLHCTFIDDYLAYHKLLGEIHCGTNVRRKPFPFKWWHVVP